VKTTVIAGRILNIALLWTYSEATDLRKRVATLEDTPSSLLVNQANRGSFLLRALPVRASCGTWAFKRVHTLAVHFPARWCDGSRRWYGRRRHCENTSQTHELLRHCPSMVSPRAIEVAVEFGACLTRSSVMRWSSYKPILDMTMLLISKSLTNSSVHVVLRLRPSSHCVRQHLEGVP
jgi:hypothetical protein